MKMYILVGAAALLAIVLMTVQAIAMTGSLTAVGSVTDERSNPVQSAIVTLIDDNFHELGTTTSDVNGNFKFQNVGLAGSSTIKVKVSFIYNGTTYTNRLENMQWYDASSGLINVNATDTRLYHYPESDHGYVWGPILDGGGTSGTLDGTVYLVNNTTTIAAEASQNGYYQIKAAPGDYEIYALHKAGNYLFVSNRTKITIAPSYAVEDSAPLALVADVVILASSTQIPPVDKFTALGTVTDQQGNPVEGASVTLIDDSFRTLGTTTTDANGNFRFIDTNTMGSEIVKVKVSYVHEGQTYNTSLENLRWNDVSSGLINFNLMETRLYNYPSGNHGYVWGVVMDNPATGRAMDSTVYLRNNTAIISTNTSVAGMGSFNFEVTPGEYEIYAVHDSEDGRFISNQTTIHVYQSNDLLLSAPIDLFVDQKDSGRPVNVLSLVAALALGLVLIIAGLAILGRKE
jgi:hypothetical protein